MSSAITRAIAETYTRRHASGLGSTGVQQPYANVGYWPDGTTTIAAACDALTDLVARAACMGPADRVLEVGCGCGASAAFYTDRYTPASVVCVDVTEVRVGIAKRLLARHHLSDRVRVHQGDATKLDFPPGSFTKVLAIECAFHFDTRLDFLREAARVLEPGGILALTDEIPQRGVDIPSFLERESPVCADASLDIPANAYDADIYTEHLQNVGFPDVRIESITERTIPFFCDHMDREGARVGGERGENIRRIGQRYRAFMAGGVEYVLVVAKKR